MDLLSLAKTVATRVEVEASRLNVPVSVCVIDTHGNGGVGISGGSVEQDVAILAAALR